MPPPPWSTSPFSDFMTPGLRRPGGGGRASRGRRADGDAGAAPQAQRGEEVGGREELARGAGRCRASYDGKDEPRRLFLLDASEFLILCF